MAPKTKTTKGKPNPKIQFTHPTFSFHRSIAHHCLPLSKYCKLPSNQGKTIVARAAVVFQNAGSQSAGPPRVLLLHRKDGPGPGGSMWELPGDQVRLGTDQTVFETIARGVREQTGLVVTNIARHFGNVEWEHEGGKYKGIHFLCTAKVVQRDEEVGKEGQVEGRQEGGGQEGKDGQGHESQGQSGQEGGVEVKKDSQNQDGAAPSLIRLDKAHDQFMWATAGDLLQLNVMTPVKRDGKEGTQEGQGDQA
ncbi:hypothetical protein DB88DRAFT_540028 [Papiliotrema laurentii]|uniref:Nudix hydrolase domain-containing protein n=1 Tax=Papiliotrema laurentii TaxID=5418 RepID=A0AAD9FQ46_PAPLA|nr:hypothetical protein DB88DRAFT_540028 [Papiliotrema laurentii]